MLLPKNLYEVLPYTYMTAGVAEIGLFDSILAMSSGILMFIAGALVWILRSNYRRVDAGYAKHSATKQGFYELKPFCLIALGVVVIQTVDVNSASFFASLAILVGSYIWYLRIQNRHRELKFSR